MSNPAARPTGFGTLRPRNSVSSDECSYEYSGEARFQRSFRLKNHWAISCEKSGSNPKSNGRISLYIHGIPVFVCGSLFRSSGKVDDQARDKCAARLVGVWQKPSFSFNLGLKSGPRRISASSAIRSESQRSIFPASNHTWQRTIPYWPLSSLRRHRNSRMRRRSLRLRNRHVCPRKNLTRPATGPHRTPWRTPSNCMMESSTTSGVVYQGCINSGRLRSSGLIARRRCS